MTMKIIFWSSIMIDNNNALSLTFRRSHALRCHGARVWKNLLYPILSQWRTFWISLPIVYLYNSFLFFFLLRVNSFFLSLIYFTIHLLIHSFIHSFILSCFPSFFLLFSGRRRNCQPGVWRLPAHFWRRSVLCFSRTHACPDYHYLGTDCLAHWLLFVPRHGCGFDVSDDFYFFILFILFF